MDTLISATVLKKNAPAFFLTMSHLFFIAIFWPVLKEFFSWKQLRADYSKNIWKEKKMRTRFSLSLGWLHICANELLKTAVMLSCWVQVLIKQEKQLVFVELWPFFPDIQRERRYQRISKRLCFVLLHKIYSVITSP